MNCRLQKSSREIALQGLFKKNEGKKAQYFIFSSLFSLQSNKLVSSLASCVLQSGARSITFKEQARETYLVREDLRF
jgi:hypothetical protein